MFHLLSCHSGSFFTKKPGPLTSVVSPVSMEWPQYVNNHVIFLFVCPTQCCLFIYFDCQSFMTFWFPFVESELGGKSYTGEEECWNKLFGPYLQFSSFLESAKDPTSSIKMDFSLIAFGPPKTGNNPCWLSMGYKTELVLLMRTARQLGRGWWWAEATNWHLFLACNAPSVRSPSKGSPAETHFF